MNQATTVAAIVQMRILREKTSNLPTVMALGNGRARI